MIVAQMSETSKNSHLGVHWFRRDLRVTGNPALLANWTQTKGRVLGLFIFDRKFLSRPDFSHNRFAFFINSLEVLKKDLESIGVELLVIDDSPEKGFGRLLNDLKKSYSHISVSFNKDYEPFARKRDELVQKVIVDCRASVLTEPDHLIVEPLDALKPDHEAYKVYSPYFRKWLSVLNEPAAQARIERQRKSLEVLSKGRPQSENLVQWSSCLQQPLDFPDTLAEFKLANQKKVLIPIPAAGFSAALDTVQTFRSKVDEYGDQRDIPSIAGTSRFSIFLKNGSLTSAQIIAALDLLKAKPASSAEKFLKEIAWREFYYSILYHFPRVETETFIEKFNSIPWDNNDVFFKKWCEGQTGFPIIDAGMRELNTTGWMHNRVRMIVASFLTKDLLIDWKWGEKYFMEKLLDGDLAPNNGGWQWAASTGCDPQPYFRIFNPWLQSERFDPEGSYIRKFVPELQLVSTKALHDPAAHRGQFGYPNPLVIHSEQKDKALALYKGRTLD